RRQELGRRRSRQDHADGGQGLERQRHRRARLVHRGPAFRRRRQHRRKINFYTERRRRGAAGAKEPLMLSRISRFAAAVLVSACAFASVHAQTPAWEAGKNYFIIDPPQPSTSDKIEVTEVFSYGCPACNMAQPTIEALAKHLPPNAVMNYVPAAFNPAEDWPLFQRTYYTAQALGLAEKTHQAMYDAVWKTKELATMNPDGRSLKNPQPSLEEVAQFFTRFGVKPEDFIATANSFAINTKMRKADAYIKATGVDSTPTIIVAGKYRLQVNTAGGYDKVEPLVRYLIDKETSGK